MRDRWHSTGTRWTRSLAQRFIEKIDRSNDCWEWTAARTRAGYGLITDGGKQIYAHRLAVEMGARQIPKGWEVCHRCDNPGCVNPAHLFVGTRRDNHHDMVAKGRHDFSGLALGRNKG